MMRQLWSDESGAALSLELIVAATILGIGMVTGLSAVQVAAVTELADVGGAISAVNQSYKSGGSTGHHALTANSEFQDLTDSCDDLGCIQSGENSRCVQVCELDEKEGENTAGN